MTNIHIGVDDVDATAEMIPLLNQPAQYSPRCHSLYRQPQVCSLNEILQGNALN